MDTEVVEAPARGHAGRSPLAGLTPREQDLLARITTGKNNRAVEKHIDNQLGLGEKPELHTRVKAVLLHLAR